MRAARDSLIGLLARTLSGGYKQWTINKQKAVLDAEQSSLQEERKKGGRLMADTGVRLATGELSSVLQLQKEGGVKRATIDLVLISGHRVLDPLPDRTTGFGSVLARDRND